MKPCSIILDKLEVIMKRPFILFSLVSSFVIGVVISVFGQTTSSNLFYNNGDLVTIQPGAVLHVQGDYVNAVSGTNATATTKNDGVLNVEGNLTNSSTTVGATTYTSAFSYTSGAPSTAERTIRLIGNSYLAGTSGEQIISGFNTAGAIYNLVIDRGSTQVVRLGSDMVVDGSLVWNSSGVTAATYTPSSFPTTLGASSLMQVRTASGASYAYGAPTGNGLIKTYSSGGTDYELYLGNGAYNALAGYQPISAYGFATSRAATTKDGYLETRADAGVSKGFSRLINDAGSPTTSVYVFPVGGVAATYNPIKLYFNTLSGTIKLTSKFTDDAVASLSSATFYNHFDEGNSVAPANLLDTVHLYPINYTLNPGYNIFERSAWTGLPTPAGDWLILNKASLNGHGYWSFDPTTISGTPAYTYTVEAYPHGYNEYSGVNHDPPKRMIRENTDAFASAPSAVNFENQLLYGLSSNSDLATYTYYPNGHHKNFASCNDGADGITGGMYSSFSHFGVGTNSVGNTNTALPVKLIDLTATPIDNSYIRVDWATASEVDNKGFQVWRSEDGINFINIGWVDGHGTTNQQNNYFLNDHAVVPGITYYYKLNQIDIDGHGTESWIVSAEITDGPSLVISELQPNPTSGATKVTISTTDALPAYIKFFDILGKEIISNDYQLTYGTTVIDLQTANLANATYTVVIKVGNKFFSKKLVVVK